VSPTNAPLPGPLRRRGRAKARKLAFTYQAIASRKASRKLAGEFGAEHAHPAVRRDERRRNRRRLQNRRRKIRQGCICSCTRGVRAEGRARRRIRKNQPRGRSAIAHDVSAYSLVALSRAAAPLMPDGGSIIGMSYYGAEKVRAALQRHGRGQGRARSQHTLSRLRSRPEKNSGSIASGAGPVNTLAARGISGFNEMIKHYEVHAPAQTQCAARRTRRDRSVPRQRRCRGHHRPGALRGLRLPDHGDVAVPPCGMRTRLLRFDKRGYKCPVHIVGERQQFALGFQLEISVFVSKTVSRLPGFLRLRLHVL